MIRQVNLSLSPQAAADEEKVVRLILANAGENSGDNATVRILKKSVDARSRNIKINITAEVISGDDLVADTIPLFVQRDVSRSEEVLIIGAGPAGLFAALRLIELGYKPVILERGRDVSTRKADIARISREHVVDPDSNYCFGEGGAGTFSDGKLYTRSKKRGDNTRVLELLCLHGADKKILYEAHPHLGTDRLPGIIRAIRKTIIDSGGLILFEHRVLDIDLQFGSFFSLTTNGNKKFRSASLVMATGHSARDIYELLVAKGIDLEAKSFAMGVRVEHPQELIDTIQYHGIKRGTLLPAASYSLVKQVDGRGVYSFCMCPGGFIVPSATSQEEIVVNGMSPSRRNSPYANSGIVVEIRQEDTFKYSVAGIMAGIRYQEDLESLAWKNSDMTQRAPAQRLTDFITGKQSGSLPESSYFPGITSSPIHQWLPAEISRRLRDGFRQFGNSMKGYVTNDALVLGVESRTSSPLRIPRDPETLEHVRIKGIFPCGEGSGYSGGIVSSAIDGMRIADAIARKGSN
ncbi:MAG: NAD(P)/FAD-dependent oxidoreductase [Bacteroidales bacterium]